MSPLIPITYLVSSLARTGPTNQLFYIIRGLDKEKFNISILTLSPSERNDLLDKFASLGVEVLPLCRSRISSVSTLIPKIKRILDFSKTQILHTQGIRSDWISSRISNPPFRISTKRNDPIMDYPSHYGWFLGNIMAWTHLRIFKKIPVVVSCSRTLHSLNSSCSSNSIYIQNGVDTSPLSLSNAIRDSLRKQLGIPSDAVVFIVVAALNPRKQVQLILRAFCKASRDNAFLLIVGDGPERNSILEFCNRSSNIRFLGFRSDVDYLYSCSNCYISASTSEGLPNTVLEAMRSSLPVFLSDIEQHREILEIDLSAGHFFSVGDELGLAGLIKNFKPSEASSVASRKIVYENFSAARMAESYQSLYLKGLGEFQ